MYFSKSNNKTFVIIKNNKLSQNQQYSSLSFWEYFLYYIKIIYRYIHENDFKF